MSTASSAVRGRLVPGVAATVGLVAVFTALSEAAVEVRWLAAIGAVGAVASAWRRTRWLAALAPLSVLALSAGGATATTAVLAGALVVGFLLLVDLAETLGMPDLAHRVPAAPPAAGMKASAGAGWASSAGVVWLAGAVVGVVVAVVPILAETAAAGLVALAPLFAIGAAYVAVGRQRT